MTVRIYQPAKSAMQSGRGKLDQWAIDMDSSRPQTADPLMGWIGGAETAVQVKLRFATRDEAVAYAKRHKLDYVVVEPRPAKQQIRAYADNFKHDRVL